MKTALSFNFSSETDDGGDRSNKHVLVKLMGRRGMCFKSKYLVLKKLFEDVHGIMDDGLT